MRQAVALGFLLLLMPRMVSAPLTLEWTYSDADLTAAPGAYFVVRADSGVPVNVGRPEAGTVVGGKLYRAALPDTTAIGGVKACAVYDSVELCSAEITASAPPPDPPATTISVSPVSVAPGANLTVTWTCAGATCSPNDWIGIFTSSGTLVWSNAVYLVGPTFTVLGSNWPMTPGGYEFRYCFASGPCPSAASFTVTAPPPPPPPTGCTYNGTSYPVGSVVTRTAKQNQISATVASMPGWAYLGAAPQGKGGNYKLTFECQ